MISRNSRIYGLLFVLLVPIHGGAGQEIRNFQGPEIENFLSKAKIVELVDIGEGVTKPQKATLDLSGDVRYGVFKTVDILRKGMTRVGNDMELNFQDSFRTEIAAYELDRLIGLGMVPATLERSERGQRGSMQSWIDSKMSEAERFEARLLPPDRAAWAQMMSKVKSFDSLIYNTDRHQKNIRITEDWQIVLIDHSRAFRTTEELRDLDQMTIFSKSFLENIAKLDEGVLKERVGKYLTRFQIRSVLKRRDLLLERARQLVDEKGEERVLFP